VVISRWHNAIIRVLAVATILLTGVVQAFAESPPAFDELLAEASATFTPPVGFKATTPTPFPAFPFDHALEAQDGSIEIHYAIRPIARMEIKYEDPHNSAPNPNHIFPLVFNALVGQLSAGGYTPSRQFPDATARERFNADWASAAVFDLEPAVSTDHRFGFLMAMHRNNRADVYVLFLYSDPASAKPRIDGLLDHLLFGGRPPAKPTSSAAH